MILICYVLVSNWLKFYLWRPFSFKSYMKKINLALETYFVLLVSLKN